ncbi:MAG: helix-hairpin-helix domain-containing protein [bacterium]|nr:helix-hairpin-helix domain-containing protein [bacterium]
MKKRLVKLLLVLTFLGATGIFYSCENSNQAASVFDTKESTAPSATAAAKESKSNDTKETVSETAKTTLQDICVYVCGQVKKPGVYTVKPGARVNDVVKMAGGLTKDAYSEGVNLAKTVSDEEQLYIPSKKEAKSGNYPTQTADKTDSTEKSDTKMSQKSGNTGKININTASKEELKSLPGIGDSKAESIISYRETNGSFATVEDLMKITGIKSGVFTKIKEYITVE